MSCSRFHTSLSLMWRFTLKDNEIINDDLQLRYMQKQELDDHLSNGSGNLDTHKREDHIQG